MNKKELLELLDAWENLELIVRNIGENPEQFSVLLDIVFHHSEKKSWRAAYLLDKIHDDYPELISPYLDAMIVKLKTEKNLSKKRHFLKLISMNEIPAQHSGFLFEYCMATLVSAEPPAVRVHAMQILFNISEKQPELKHELLLVIQHEMEYHATAGIRSRGSKLAKKLQLQIRQINQN